MLLLPIKSFQTLPGHCHRSICRKKQKNQNKNWSRCCIFISGSFCIIGNDDLDRNVVVTGRTTEGTVIQEATFTIIQLGLREEFIPADSDEAMQDNSGEIFGVLKE